MKNVLKNITAEQFNNDFRVGSKFYVHPQIFHCDELITITKGWTATTREPAMTYCGGNNATVLVTNCKTPVSITQLEPLMNDEQIETLKRIRHGANVYGHQLIDDFRDIERYWSHYFYIYKPLAYFDDESVQIPYFGAITTAAGNQFLASLEAKNDE